jgi:hypothetical protein
MYVKERMEATGEKNERDMRHISNIVQYSQNTIFAEKFIELN